MGFNAYVSMITCLACGFSEKEKKQERPTHDLDHCPHVSSDRRGSSKTTVMFYCKQCCTHVDARDRARVEVQERVNSQMQVASQPQQRLAAAILEEKEVNPEKLQRFFILYQGLLTEYMADKWTYHPPP